MSIPLARIPSIEFLRGFVAVGRRMSITLAAQDLFLTQSAVSRQKTEEHTSEPSHRCISYAVFCLKKRSNPVSLRTCYHVI